MADVFSYSLSNTKRRAFGPPLKIILLLLNYTFLLSALLPLDLQCIHRKW
jgi:Na+/H+ antiporter NhaD/arsenite permease-like protein